MLRIITVLFFLQFSLPEVILAQNASYTLKGKIDNWSHPAKAFLIYEKNDSIYIDSTQITGGAFSFKAVANDPYTSPFLMVSESGNRMSSTGAITTSFYVDANVISVALDKFGTKLVVTGGKLNRDWERLKMDLAPVEAKITAAYELYERTRNEKKNGKAFEENFWKNMRNLEEDKKMIYRQFIKSHPDSYISLEALNSLGGNMPDANDIEAPFYSLSAEVRSTKKGKEFASNIAELKKLVVGVKAPDFTLYDTSGNAVSLHNFDGKYVLLDFWASWCPPCRAESPYIADALATYQKKNFTVLGVSLDNPDKKDAWIKAIHEDGVTWAQVSSLQMWENEAAKLYSVTAIPQNFLIAPDGKIIAKNLRGPALKEKLQELLGE